MMQETGEKQGDGMWDVGCGMYDFFSFIFLLTDIVFL